jgi:hypothetical protein
MKYVSHLMTFLDGRRYRPGEPFELPEGVAPAPSMQPFGQPLKKDEPKLGDTKPEAAQKAAKAKASGGADA